jgi:phage baseplate assembly protein W
MSETGKSQYVALKLPFRIGANGVVETTTDHRVMWQDRVKSVILTAKYERVNRPGFGSTIYEAIHSGVGGVEGAEEQVTAAIYTAFSEFLSPALTVKDVEVNYDYDNGVMSVNLSYKLPDNTADTLSLNRLSINKQDPPTYLELFTEGA